MHIWFSLDPLPQDFRQFIFTSLIREHGNNIEWQTIILDGTVSTRLTLSQEIWTNNYCGHFQPYRALTLCRHMLPGLFNLCLGYKTWDIKRSIKKKLLSPLYRILYILNVHTHAFKTLNLISLFFDSFKLWQCKATLIKNHGSFESSVQNYISCWFWSSAIT